MNCAALNLTLCQIIGIRVFRNAVNFYTVALAWGFYQIYIPASRG